MGKIADALKSIEPRIGRTQALKEVNQANSNIKDGIDTVEEIANKVNDTIKDGTEAIKGGTEAITKLNTTIDTAVNKADGWLVYIRDKLEYYMSVHGLLEILGKIILIKVIYEMFETNKLKITDIFNMLLDSLPIPVPGRRKRFQIPTLEFLYLLGVLIYIVSPFDLIPDNIPIWGYTDDAFFLQRYIKMFVTWVNRWKYWNKIGGAQQTVRILGDNTIRWREEQEQEREHAQ